VYRNGRKWCKAAHYCLTHCTLPNESLNTQYARSYGTWDKTLGLKLAFVENIFVPFGAPIAISSIPP
jgi:hypothetical protein